MDKEPLFTSVSVMNSYKNVSCWNLKLQVSKPAIGTALVTPRKTPGSTVMPMKTDESQKRNHHYSSCSTFSEQHGTLCAHENTSMKMKSGFPSQSVYPLPTALQENVAIVLMSLSGAVSSRGGLCSLHAMLKTCGCWLSLKWGQSHAFLTGEHKSLYSRWWPITSRFWSN